MDSLYEDAWTPTLQRFRPPFAFRGLPDKSFALNTSLMRMGDDCERMDWTLSPHVALHFVKANTERYDRDGVIWCLDYRKVHQQLPDSLANVLSEEGADVFTIDMLSHIKTLREFDTQAENPFALFFEPTSIDDRIVNQYALFSVISSRLALR